MAPCVGAAPLEGIFQPFSRGPLRSFHIRRSQTSQQRFRRLRPASPPSPSSDSYPSLQTRDACSPRSLGEHGRSAFQPVLSSFARPSPPRDSTQHWLSIRATRYYSRRRRESRTPLLLRKPIASFDQVSPSALPRGPRLFLSPPPHAPPFPCTPQHVFACLPLPLRNCLRLSPFPLREQRLSPPPSSLAQTRPFSSRRPKAVKQITYRALRRAINAFKHHKLRTDPKSVASAFLVPSSLPPSSSSSSSPSSRIAAYRGEALSRDRVHAPEPGALPLRPPTSADLRSTYADPFQFSASLVPAPLPSPPPILFHRTVTLPRSPENASQIRARRLPLGNAKKLKSFELAAALCTYAQVYVHHAALWAALVKECDGRSKHFSPAEACWVLHAFARAKERRERAAQRDGLCGSSLRLSSSSPLETEWLPSVRRASERLAAHVATNFRLLSLADAARVLHATSVLNLPDSRLFRVLCPLLPELLNAFLAQTVDAPQRLHYVLQLLVSALAREHLHLPEVLRLAGDVFASHIDAWLRARSRDSLRLQRRQRKNANSLVSGGTKERACALGEGEADDAGGAGRHTAQRKQRGPAIFHLADLGDGASPEGPKASRGSGEEAAALLPVPQRLAALLHAFSLLQFRHEKLVASTLRLVQVAASPPAAAPAAAERKLSGRLSALWAGPGCGLQGGRKGAGDESRDGLFSGSVAPAREGQGVSRLEAEERMTRTTQSVGSLDETLGARHFRDLCFSSSPASQHGKTDHRLPLSRMSPSTSTFVAALPAANCTSLLPSPASSAQVPVHLSGSALAPRSASAPTSLSRPRKTPRSPSSLQHVHSPWSGEAATARALLLAPHAFMRGGRGTGKSSASVSAAAVSVRLSRFGFSRGRKRKASQAARRGGAPRLKRADWRRMLHLTLASQVPPGRRSPFSTWNVERHKRRAAVLERQVAARRAATAAATCRDSAKHWTASQLSTILAALDALGVRSRPILELWQRAVYAHLHALPFHETVEALETASRLGWYSRAFGHRAFARVGWFLKTEKTHMRSMEDFCRVAEILSGWPGGEREVHEATRAVRRRLARLGREWLLDDAGEAALRDVWRALVRLGHVPPPSSPLSSSRSTSAAPPHLLLSAPFPVAKWHPPSPSKAPETSLNGSASPSRSSEPCREGQTVETPGGETGDSSAHRVSPPEPPPLTVPSVSSAERLFPARLSSSLSSSSSLLCLSGAQRYPLRRVAACSGCAPQRLALRSVAGVVPWRPVEAIYREAVGFSLIPALLRITVSLFPLSPPIPLTLLLPRVRKCALAGVVSLGSLHGMLQDLNALRQFRSLAAHSALRPASGQPRQLSPSAARPPPLRCSPSRDCRSIEVKGVSGEHEETRANRAGDDNKQGRLIRTSEGLSSVTAPSAMERVPRFPIERAVSGASGRETDSSRPTPEAPTRSASCAVSSEAAECVGEAQTTAAGTQRHVEDSWKTLEKKRYETFEELLEETEAALWRVTRQRVCRALTRSSAEPVQQGRHMQESGKASSLGSACLQTRRSRMQATAGAVSLEELASHGALLHGFSNALAGELVDSESLRLGRERAVETPDPRGSSALTLGSFGKASETRHGRPQPPASVQRGQKRAASEGSGRLDTTTQCVRTKGSTQETDGETLEVLAAVRETVRGSWPLAERQSSRKETPGPSGDEAEGARDVLSMKTTGDSHGQETARGWQFQSVGEAAAVLALEVAPYISNLLRPEPCGCRRTCASSLRRGEAEVRSSLSVVEACATEREDRGREAERSTFSSPEASSLSRISAPSVASLQSHWTLSLETAETGESRAKSPQVSEQRRRLAVDSDGSVFRADGPSGCPVAWEPARDILGRLVHFFSSFSQMATAKEVRQTLHIVLGFLRHPVWLNRLESHLSAALQRSWEPTACARRRRSDSVSTDLCFEWELDVLEQITAIGAALLRQQPRCVAATRADEFLVLFADLQGTARQIRRVFHTAVEAWWSARGASEENGEPTCSDRSGDDSRQLARNRIQTIDMLFGNTLQFLQLAENVMVECMYTRLREVPSLALAASPVTALNATLEACSPWLGSGHLGMRTGRGSGEGKRKETWEESSEPFAGKAARARGAATCNKLGVHTRGEAFCEPPRELKTEEQADGPAGPFTGISEEGQDVSGIQALCLNHRFRRRLEQLSFLTAVYPQAFSACSSFCEEGAPLPVETNSGFAQPVRCPDTRHSSAFHAVPSFLSTQHVCAGPATKKTEGTATATARGTCEKRSSTEEGQNAEKQLFSCSQLVSDVVWATLESERKKCIWSFGERKSWGGTRSGEGRVGESGELHKERTRASLQRATDWLMVMQRLRESPENTEERTTFEDLRWRRSHPREGVRTEENWRDMEKVELRRFVARLFVLRMVKQDAALARILDGLWVSR
ncbi:hypothetical protein TGVEG_224320 [Toxoplasma gondii VEG]|uniref:Uncharacterized protein n=1 Tax=Toxoplasma gondii (strain ATCC 50861 / VEG) TaxID=432359 RepID=B9Q7H9_TOXGV|nr:hypothetical protein TGVEG_224320 [Toxoplasma gondii VEG]CEL76667.1 TPA: hypothetical protein BN1205_065080 [Toxoplasma gondii VEG]